MSDIHWLCTACIALYLDTMENKEETKKVLSLKAFIVSVTCMKQQLTIQDSV